MKHVILLLLLSLAACADRGPMMGEVSTSGQNKGIVGGETITPQDHNSSQVVLITGKDEAGGSIVCSGTMIDFDIVLTAAHCTGKTETMKVVFGLDVRSNESLQISKVKTYLRHKKYTHDKDVHNDIALIQIDDEIPLQYTLATLPWEDKEAKLVTANSVIRAYGFGVSSGVMIDGKIGGKTDGVLRATDLAVKGLSPQGDAFVADQTKGHGICSGDSGGPAFVNGGTVAGIISRTITDDPTHPEYTDDDVCNYESIFTNVAYYQKWITRGLEKLRNDDAKSVKSSLNLPTKND